MGRWRKPATPSVMMIRKTNHGGNGPIDGGVGERHDEAGGGRSGIAAGGLEYRVEQVFAIQTLQLHDVLPSDWATAGERAPGGGEEILPQSDDPVAR